MAHFFASRKPNRPTKKELEKALELEKSAPPTFPISLNKCVRIINNGVKQRIWTPAAVCILEVIQRFEMIWLVSETILRCGHLSRLNITECRPCDGEDDIDKKSYEQWKEQLEASMNLVGVSDELMKINVFKRKAGRKLLDVLESTASSSTTPDAVSKPYSNAIRRLDDYFGSRDYVLLQRQKLRSTTQKAGESDVGYVKRVMTVAKLCEYGKEQVVENVADVLQLHAINIKVREAGRKILRKGGFFSGFNG